MPKTVVDAERFEQIRGKFAALGRDLTDEQLLVLADTYHDILRLRRGGRAWREHWDLATEPLSFAPL